MADLEHICSCGARLHHPHIHEGELVLTAEKVREIGREQLVELAREIRRRA